jgi:hypothetical protein
MKPFSNGDRRKHFRIQCTTPICTKVTIVQIDKKSVKR